MPSTPTDIKPIHPTDDVRVTHEFAVLNGRKYHYVNGNPTTPQKGVVLLCHGFPDLWYGWRYIIPFLLQEGFRVITPDLIGYGQTDKPVVDLTAADIDASAYSFRSSANDLAELLKQLNIPKVISIGHDWGSAVAQRLALHHPSLVSHVVSIAIPFLGPTKEYIPLEAIVQFLPNFAYQLTIIDPAKFENVYTTKESIGRLFAGIYQPATAAQKAGEVPDYSKPIRDFIASPTGDRNEEILTQQDLDYYVDQFDAGGVHGPSNWYRLRRQIYEDEKDVPADFQYSVPALFIEAEYDVIVPPQMKAGQEKVAPKLTYRTVQTSHWAMAEEPDQVNAVLREWFQSEVFRDSARL